MAKEARQAKALLPDDPLQEPPRTLAFCRKTRRPLRRRRNPRTRKPLGRQVPSLARLKGLRLDRQRDARLANAGTELPHRAARHHRYGPEGKNPRRLSEIPPRPPAP